MALTWSGYATAVCPGTKNVDRISWRRSISRMRGSANGPNSPREISAGFVDPSMIHTEVASKSKDRQTDSLGSDVDTATHLPPHPRRSPSDRSPAWDHARQGRRGRVEKHQVPRSSLYRCT